MCVLSQTTSHDMIHVLPGWGWDGGGVARPYKRISLVQSINVNIWPKYSQCTTHMSIVSLLVSLGNDSKWQGGGGLGKVNEPDSQLRLE